MHFRRIETAMGSTMDVLKDGSTRMVLRRYAASHAEHGEDLASRETRALELMQKNNIPAPAPLWIDSDSVFDEQAIVTSFVQGEPELSPADPFDWAEKLATTLARIHDIRLDADDLALFTAAAEDAERKSLEGLEQVAEHPLGEDLLRRRLLLDDRRVETSVVFSHTDYWPGNTLWQNGDLVAVVDWESPAMGDRAMDVAYCTLDIRYLGMDKVADRFVAAYRDATGIELANLGYWEAVGLCRPMPDIGRWVPAWNSMGRPITEDQARLRHTQLIERFLDQN